MLDVRNLRKAYGRQAAVRDVSLSLTKGDVLACLGPNGAGKTTTLRMIAGVIEPDEGEAFIDSHSIAGARREAQRRIGYLPEGAPLYPDMTPLDYLRYLSDAHGIARHARRTAIERVIADARIASVVFKRCDRLSKGYRRRVGLAGALLHDPPVLLLDEPTDGLDPLQKRAVRSLISRMAPHKAILVSTHTLEEVPAMCNRVAIIRNGETVLDDSVEALGDTLEETFIALADTPQGRAA